MRPAYHGPPKVSHLSLYCFDDRDSLIENSPHEFPRRVELGRIEKADQIKSFSFCELAIPFILSIVICCHTPPKLPYSEAHIHANDKISEHAILNMHLI